MNDGLRLRRLPFALRSFQITSTSLVAAGVGYEVMIRQDVPEQAASQFAVIIFNAVMAMQLAALAGKALGCNRKATIALQLMAAYPVIELTKHFMPPLEEDAGYLTDLYTMLPFFIIVLSARNMVGYAIDEMSQEAYNRYLGWTRIPKDDMNYLVSSITEAVTVLGVSQGMTAAAQATHRPDINFIEAGYGFTSAIGAAAITGFVEEKAKKAIEDNCAKKESSSHSSPQSDGEDSRASLLDEFQRADSSHPIAELTGLGRKPGNAESVFELDMESGSNP